MGSTQKCHAEQHECQRDELPRFDADIERNDVGDQPVWRYRKLLQLGGKPESVRQTEHQHRGPRVGLKSKPALVSVQIVERLVDHRHADQRIDQERVGMYAGEHPKQ